MYSIGPNRRSLLNHWPHFTPHVDQFCSGIDTRNFNVRPGQEHLELKTCCGRSVLKHFLVNINVLLGGLLAVTLHFSLLLARIIHEPHDVPFLFYLGCYFRVLLTA